MLIKTINAIRNQTVYLKSELLIADSGSNDGSREWLAKQKDIRLIDIDPVEFNHGLTRNIGISRSSGNFIYFTVQDAVLTASDSLANLISHFNDPKIAAVCGKQVVPNEKGVNPHEFYRPQSVPGFRKVDLEFDEWNELNPNEKRNLCAWDNVCALYRRDILEKVPFRKVSYGEDMLWAKDALLNGYTLVYDDKPAVNHYHHATFDFQLRRTFTVLYHQFKAFGYDPEWKFENLDFLKVIYRNIRYKASPKWIFHQWSRMMAVRQAYRQFSKSKQKGNANLDQVHMLLCPTPPQGKTNND